MFVRPIPIIIIQSLSVNAKNVILEVVTLVFIIAKEGRSVRHHPDVAAPAVKIGLGPMTVTVNYVYAVVCDGRLVTEIVQAVHEFT